MKIRFLLSMAVISFLFIGELAAQEVNSVLQNKEKRQMLYASIINNDVMFTEFLESTKASGRSNDGISILNAELVDANEAMTSLEFEVSENQLIMRQMVRLMKEYAIQNPEFQKAIDENYPEVGDLMEKN